MRITEDRPLSAAESRLVRWLLEHGEPGSARFLPELDALRIVARCSCGCASIDFVEDGSGPMEVIADFDLRPLGRVPGGVFLFTRGGRLAGLEVYSFGDPIAGCPDPEALVPLPVA